MKFTVVEFHLTGPILQSMSLLFPFTVPLQSLHKGKFLGREAR